MFDLDAQYTILPEDFLSQGKSCPLCRGAGAWKMPAHPLRRGDRLAGGRRGYPMKRSLFTIQDNQPLAPGTYRMTLSGDTGAITAPGQFVNIAPGGEVPPPPHLRVRLGRSGSLTLIYKVVGQGTAQMSQMTPGAGRWTCSPAWATATTCPRPGTGPCSSAAAAGVPAPVCPGQGRWWPRGKRPTVILGFNTRAEAFLRGGIPGSGRRGDRGHGGRLLWRPRLRHRRHAPGWTTPTSTPAAPSPCSGRCMGQAVTSGQFSFEERMGCGFGACMGCTCETQVRLQAHLPGGPRAGEGGDSMVNTERYSSAASRWTTR